MSGESKIASDNASHNLSGNLSGNKIGSDNSVVRIEKPALFRFGDKIYNQITNGLSKDEATKLFNDLLNPKIQELLDRLEKLEGNMNKLNKPIRDSVNALYASSEEDYEEKTKLLQNILIKKLENLDDNRAHYLTLQGIEAIKNISSDEMKLLAIMVRFFWYTPIKDYPTHEIEDYVNNFIKKVQLDEFMDKIFSGKYSKFCLHSLHSNELIIKKEINSMTAGSPECMTALKKWFFCATENELREKINKDFILLVQGTQELTELGIFCGTQILLGMGEVV